MLVLTARKFTCIFTGDLEGAVEAYELSSTLCGGLVQHVRTIPYIMSIFLDGLVALACAKKKGEDEQR